MFEKALPDVGIQAKRQDRVAVEVLEKNRVVRIDTDSKWGEKDQTISIWYAKPKPTILIAATDVRFLQTMLARMARPPASRTSLLDFPEWQYVDTQSPAWGIRHRRTANPIYIIEKPWDFTLPPSALCGTSFSYQSQPTPKLALRYHFSEEVRELLSKGLSKMQSPRLISPLVAESEWTIQDGSNTQGSEAAPAYAAFIARHFMGYTACP